jgi:subtilase family serine protease
MAMRQYSCPDRAVARVLLVSLSAAILSACGSDTGSSASTQAAAATQSFAVTLAAPASVAAGVAQPTFHLAPAVLDEPDDSDRTEPSSSAAAAPRQVPVNPAFAQLSTRRLTAQVLDQVRDTGMAPEGAWADGTTARPMASTSTVTTYTPAQIRAAYGLPALASSASGVTSAQAAQMGAGQTIYLIDAYNDPNIAAELATFDSKFGLPGCTLTAISPAASLPLAAASATGCTLSVVYGTPSASMAAAAPAYNSGWAMEIALDVQWAHATAPYARIVLIEAADNSTQNLLAGVQLANQMGPGVVSQSFGAPEDGTTSSKDAYYSVANMTYLASTGDAGAGVNWPAVSSHVLAVAGTSLTYSGTGPRTETVWSDSGGGEMSAFVATPAYQSLAVPGLTPLAHRAVADVAFNADPYTGQFLAIITPGATSATWYSGGGTSLASPQWAGILAVANALRAEAALAPIGASQPTLYGLGVQAASYAGSFLDVTKGSDGACATCYAGVGYDLPSGLGTPNAQTLLPALSAQAAVVAPVVTAASVSGKVGTALSFSITATAAHPLTYSLTGAPAGMSVNASTGLVTWNAPLLGNYSVIAHASDAHTGLSGQGTLSVSILAASPPQVTGGSESGTAQTALTFATQVADANVVTYSLSGAPSGMSVNAAGVVSWASPLTGTYAVTVIAHDATTGLSGQGLYTVTIGAPKAPSVTSASVSSTVGKALSFCVNANDTNPLAFSLTGAPAGMTIANTGCVTWNAPTLGAFTVTVTAQDTKTGLTGKGVYTISITRGGPVIAVSGFTGVAGKALIGSITITDGTASALSIRISGLPAAMGFAPSGNELTVQWASPVTGNYSLQVTATDSQNLTATATIPVTITAH